MRCGGGSCKEEGQCGGSMHTLARSRMHTRARTHTCSLMCMYTRMRTHERMVQAEDARMRRKAEEEAARKMAADLAAWKKVPHTPKYVHLRARMLARPPSGTHLARHPPPPPLLVHLYVPSHTCAWTRAHMYVQVGEAAARREAETRKPRAVPDQARVAVFMRKGLRVPCACTVARAQRKSETPLTATCPQPLLPRPLLPPATVAALLHPGLSVLEKHAKVYFGHRSFPCWRRAPVFRHTYVSA